MYVDELYRNLFKNVQMATPSPPVLCNSYDECSSYLFPGPASLIIPTPVYISNFSDADAIQVYGSASVQIDYWKPNVSDQWSSADCRIWGSNESAIQICIGSQDYLISGTFTAFVQFINIEV